MGGRQLNWRKTEEENNNNNNKTDKNGNGTEQKTPHKVAVKGEH